MHECARDFCLNGYSVKIHVPDNVKYNTDDEKNQTCYKNTIAVALFQLSQLSFTVLSVELMVLSAHRNECLNDVSQNESYSNEGSLTANEQQGCKHCKHKSRNKETVGKDLNINCEGMDEKAFYSKYQ